MEEEPSPLLPLYSYSQWLVSIALVLFFLSAWFPERSCSDHSGLGERTEMNKPAINSRKWKLGFHKATLISCSEALAFTSLLHIIHADSIWLCKGQQRLPEMFLMLSSLGGRIEMYTWLSEQSEWNQSYSLFKIKRWKYGQSIVLSLIKLRLLAHEQGTTLSTTLVRIWHRAMSLATILCPPAAAGITQENLICITQH